ncbi:MAG: glycosyltransferase family 2 protein [bacterium]
MAETRTTFQRSYLPQKAFEIDRDLIPDLSICIVNWNTRDMLRDCLNSIWKHKDDLNIEVFVIDNASSDGSAEMIKTEFSTVTLIENNENKGFAQANNQGIAKATGRYILLLNPDTIILEEALRRMTRFLDENPNAGAVAARLMNTDGSLQFSLRQFPNFLTPFTENTNLATLPGIFWCSQKSRLMRWPHDSVREVEQPAGAALMIKRSCIETLGSLNGSFHMFFEDVDICYRIRNNGWKIYYLPEALIIHHGGQSVKKRTDMGTQFYRSLLKFSRLHRGKGWEFSMRMSMMILATYCFAISLILLPFKPSRAMSIGKSAMNVIRAVFYRVAVY